MVSTLTPPLPQPGPLSIERYLRLAEEGVFDDRRVELLDGDVVEMPPIGSRHVVTLDDLRDAIARRVGDRACIRTQSPLALGRDSLPQPDLCIVPGRRADYRDAHPTSALLVIEVSDTTLRLDRTTKAALYARAGVPEYWIVNLVDEQIEVHRTPDATQARYTEIRVLRADKSVSTHTFPDVVLDVGIVLGRAAER